MQAFTCKLIFQLGPVIKLDVFLLIVIKHHFAFVGIHHMTLNTMQGYELACICVVTSDVQRDMTILQLETLRKHKHRWAGCQESGNMKTIRAVLCTVIIPLLPVMQRVLEQQTGKHQKHARHGKLHDLA